MALLRYYLIELQLQISEQNSLVSTLNGLTVQGKTALTSYI